ncbi:MAG: regulatory protein RecX [Deltaproteobacteria bacterium]|nr:regulatory protein RecX [Deltaproteobacteria bacterium]
MSDPTPEEQARALALRVLAFHARTEAQLRRRLRGAGYAAEQDAVVEWLRRLGYLDDRGWAEATARALLRPGRLGPRAAERRLLAAGIPAAQAKEQIAAALAEAGGAGAGSPEVVLCRALAERRTRGAAPAELPPKERVRLARFLLSRGFGGEAVHRVVGLPEEGDG